MDTDFWENQVTVVVALASVPTLMNLVLFYISRRHGSVNFLLTSMVIVLPLVFVFAFQIAPLDHRQIDPRRTVSMARSIDKLAQLSVMHISSTDKAAQTKFTKKLASDIFHRGSSLITELNKTALLIITGIFMASSYFFREFAALYKLKSSETSFSNLTEISVLALSLVFISSSVALIVSAFLKTYSLLTIELQYGLSYTSLTWRIIEHNVISQYRYTTFACFFLVLSYVFLYIVKLSPERRIEK